MDGDEGVATGVGIETNNDRLNGSSAMDLTRPTGLEGPAVGSEGEGEESEDEDDDRSKDQRRGIDRGDRMHHASMDEQQRYQEELMAAVRRQTAAQAMAAQALGPYFGQLSPEQVLALMTGGHHTGHNLNMVSSSSVGLPVSSSTHLHHNSHHGHHHHSLSSSSPSGASGSSGGHPQQSSSPGLNSIEANKGYTFEEQFKQVTCPDKHVGGVSEKIHSLHTGWCAPKRLHARRRPSLESRRESCITFLTHSFGCSSTKLMTIRNERNSSMISSASCKSEVIKPMS